MLQILLPTARIDQAASTAQARDFFTDPLVVGILTALGLLLGLFFVLLIVVGRLRKGKEVSPDQQKKILRILVPKESLQQEGDAKTSDSQQSMRESIAVAETFFSSIGGIRVPRGLKTWLFGREDTIAFEIVVKDEQIYFYVAAPKYLLKYMEQQIQAQFPEAQIDDTEDYNIFHPRGYIYGATIRLARESYFPIKTYQEIESDPLNALLAPLSSVGKEDAAAIQFLVRPAHKSWHVLGRKIASAMRQGKNVKDAQREVHGGVLKIFGSALPSSKKNEDQKEPKQYQLSPLEEEMIKRLETKSSKAGVEANIRVIVSSASQQQAQAHLDSLVGSFAQYNIYEYGNSFKPVRPRKQEKLIEDFIFRHFNPKQSMILNTEEMASLYHFPLPQTEATNIKWLEAKRAPAPINVPKEGLLLGYNLYRNKETKIYIKDEDRRRHQYIIGKSGSGKSFLMANMARQDVKNGKGVCIIDPHGDLVDDVLAAVPKERIEDVIIFDPADTSYPMGMNLLEYDPRYPEQKTFVINEMIKIFDRLYDLKSTGGPMFEQYVRNAMLLIMDDPESGSTLMEISKVLAQEDFRRYKLSKCKNPVVKDFWEKEAEKAGGEAALANIVPYVTSKLNQFIANDIMRPIIGQQESAFNFRQLMDEQKILLVKLSKGKIGDLNASLLGLVFVGKILMAALSRTDQAKADRKDFYLYIDEFQNFTTDSIAIILSEARKYALDLIIAHQYVGQLTDRGDTTIKDAVFGNVGTLMAFKIGVEDAEIFAKEFAPVFNEYDVLNVEQHSCYVKLLVDNQTLRPFSMKTYGLEEGHPKHVMDAIYELSRLKYGKPREEVEQEIINRQGKAFATSSVATGEPSSSPFDDL